jgi:hypothetical protein
MEVRTHHRKEKKEQDADQDYPQSDPEIQIICVWNSAVGGRYAGTDTGSRDSASVK